MQLVPEVKAKWLAALRSGDYKQGKGRLHIANGSTPDEYCCLGVLCELAVEEGVTAKKTASDLPYMTPGNLYGDPESLDDGYGYNSYLPQKVAEWAAGADGHTNPYFQDAEGTKYLANLNDDGKTFEEIADIIEREF